MDFSELSHQTEIRDSLDKILSEHCSQERLKKYDAVFLKTHLTNCGATATSYTLARQSCVKMDASFLSVAHQRAK